MRGFFRAVGWGLLCGLFMACLVIGLPGCAPATEGVSKGQDLGITSTKPDEYGVVCYTRVESSGKLSCVQVQEGRTR